MSAVAWKLARNTGIGDDCWEWRGSRSIWGYGVVAFGKKQYRAHRLMYEELVGPIPDGLHLDHLCRNRGCVNPAHLEPVTAQENNRRAGTQYNRAKWQKAKTHCPAGHLYGLDTYTYPDGRRRCRICHRAACARYRNKERRD